MSKQIIYLYLYILFCSCATIKEFSYDLPPLITVDYVDIHRFMGDWYVIANIPTYFEKHATNSIESYKLVNNEINTTFSFYNKSPKGIRKVYNYNAKIYTGTGVMGKFV